VAIKYLQSVLEEKAQKSTEKSLIQLLVKNMGKYYPERSHKTVHASDVTKEDFCPRQYRLMDAHNVVRPESFISAASRATFDLGSLTADTLVTKWAGPLAWGKWECEICHKTIDFGPRPESICSSPPKRCKWKYHEVNFVSQQSKISGSIDLLADLHKPKKTVVELKIMKADDFDKLAAPLAEHRLRTMLYLQLIAESDNPIRFQVDTDHAKVLYVSRGYGKMNADIGQIVPFKEFDVYRDDSAVKTFSELGKAVYLSRAEGTIPEHKVCPHAACTTAKKCPVRTQCWSGA